MSKKAALNLKCRQCFYRLGALVRAFRLIDPECQRPAYATGSSAAVMVLYLVDAREAIVGTDVRGARWATVGHGRALSGTLGHCGALWGSGLCAAGDAE